MFSYFERKTNPFPTLDQRPPPEGLWPFIFHYCRGFFWPLAIITGAGIAIAVLEVLLFNFVGDIVNWLGAKREGSAGQLLTMGLIVLLVLPLCRGLQTFTRMQCIMGNLPMAIRWRIHNYLLNQSMSFYQDEFAGRVSARVMQMALAIREVMTTITDILIYALVYITSILVLLAKQHWLLLAIMLAWLVGYISLLYYFLPRFAKASEEQSGARSLMTGRITDAYSNIATVKLFAHSSFEANYARAAMREFLDSVYGQMRLGSKFDFCLNCLVYLLIFTITAAGLLLWQEGLITVGAIAMASTLSLRMNDMAHWIMFESYGLFEAIGTIDDGRAMLQRPIAVQDVAGAKDLVVKQGQIDFKDVSFGYNKNNTRHVISHLNLTIGAGEKIGLVGRSGAGKSTLVNALLRFYNLDGGQILIDGQDISQVTQDSLRRHIAMVSQDTALLHRSIRENVLYGRPEASEAELLAALEKAEALDFIDQLTDPKGNAGLDAQVGERGVKLSGGQRQRIAIARVLLKDAPILILDEAISALDSEVESAIQASLLGLMRGKTVIAIAHRLSTIAQMERLIILDKGQIVEEGSHEELLARGGLYSQLWARQTGGYLGD